jgi:hypothetical protein
MQITAGAEFLSYSAVFGLLRYDTNCFSQGKTMSRFAASAKPGAATRHPPPASRSLSLNRWILPVAVLGNSAMNSMARGYL